MAVLEELIHSTQEKLHQINKEAAMQVNKINEELAGIILELDTEKVNMLAEYCQLQTVPDDFPFAKRANLFFFLNPDHFLIEQIGPDVMTFTHVEMDPKIKEAIPQLLDIYKRWLAPIQHHHAHNVWRDAVVMEWPFSCQKPAPPLTDIQTLLPALN